MLDAPFVNIDADPSFFYGEIAEADFMAILDAGKKPGSTMDFAIKDYCRRTRNHYFLEYALDPRRALGIKLLGDLAGKRVLDYGCGIGSLSIVAARHGAHVVLVDNCLPRLGMAALRFQQEGLSFEAYACRNWSSLPESVCDIDAILVNGVLEWIPSTVGASFETALETQFLFLRALRERLSCQGRLYIAIENRFALQYLMGYPEDHTDIPFLSLMDRRAANAVHKREKGTDFTAWTWGIDEFRAYLPGLELELREAYGIFPDYRFPRMIAALEDPQALRRGLDMEGYEVSAMRTRLADYFLSSGLIDRVVYSYALIVGRI